MVEARETLRRIYSKLAKKLFGITTGNRGREREINVNKYKMEILVLKGGNALET